LSLIIPYEVSFVLYLFNTSVIDPKVVTFGLTERASIK